MPGGLHGSTSGSTWILDLLKCKKNIYAEWKQEWVTREDYKKLSEQPGIRLEKLKPRQN